MAAINFAAHAAIANRSVNSIGKINRRSAHGQGNKLALGCETKHLVMEQFKARMFQKFFGAVTLLQHIHQMPQPAISIGLSCRNANPRFGLFGFANVFIKRMGRNPTFRNIMHFKSANLHFNTLRMRANHDGVERAIIILLAV